MNVEILEGCYRLALDGKLSFPESIQRMAAVGVERYRADLVRMEKMHYSAAGETQAIAMDLTGAPPFAEEFDEEGIKDALLAIQSGKIDYSEFLRRIMSAGVTDYGVWLRGKLAIYFGHAGEFYIEKFPVKK